MDQTRPCEQHCIVEGNIVEKKVSMLKVLTNDYKLYLSYVCSFCEA